MCNKSEQHIHKRIFNETSRETFKLRLREINWDNLKTSNDSNLAYNEFLPRVKMNMKARNSFRSWITNGIANSSKKKQKLYEKYSKNHNPQNLAPCKTYKNLFETIKRKSKKNYNSEKILSFKGDTKKSWKTMKYLIGKAKMKQIIVSTKNQS